METRDVLLKVFGADLNIPVNENNHIRMINDYIIKKLGKVSDKKNKTGEDIDDDDDNDVNDEDDDDDDGEDRRSGRIGKKIVRFDVSAHHGFIILSPDRLSISSQSNFSTIRANTGIYSGKWMYELQLGSKGVMQLGWGTSNCKFNQQIGVGDTVNSYGFDGNRVRKWNVSTKKYGEPWLSGDVIGCTIDIDNGIIDYYRNGYHLGKAFDNIEKGVGIVYFPTVSLAFTENLTANFGATPLKYPVDGYQPLELPPKKQINQSRILFEWLNNLLKLLNDMNGTSTATATVSLIVDDKKRNNIKLKTYVMSIVRLVIHYLGPLLTINYIIEFIFLPFVEKILMINSNNNEILNLFLDILWAFLEDNEIKYCLEISAIYLLSIFRRVSLILDYPDQCKSLKLLTNFCRHKETRQYLLNNILFDRLRFANFIHIKPLDERGLCDIIKKSWWQTSNPIDLTIELNKSDYFNVCDNIKTSINIIETLQVELLLTFLDNTDGNNKKPSSRIIFLKKFRKFVQENLISSRTPLQITICCFHRLLVAFKILWDNEIGSTSSSSPPLPIYIPCKLFYDSSINYTGIDRLGGVLSYLNKTYKNELIHHLGPDHPVIISMESQNQSQSQSQTQSNNTFITGPEHFNQMAAVVIPTATRILALNSTSTTRNNGLIFGYSSNSSSSATSSSDNQNNDDKTATTAVNKDDNNSVISLLEFLEGIILFYHSSAKKQIAKVSNLRDSMNDYIKALSDVKNRLELIEKINNNSCYNNYNINNKNNNDIIIKQLNHTIDILNKKLCEQSRHMAWVRAVVYSEEKQSHLVWLLKVVLLTLNKASEEGNMFRFVPDFYLEALADLSIGIKNHLHPTIPIENIIGYKDMLKEIGEFLCNHFLDPRIVNTISKDTLILTLAGYTSNPMTLEALELISENSKIHFIKNILQPYENRAWAQFNWILVRFWQGNGFAFRYEKSPHLYKKIGPKMLQQESISQPIKPCPSLIFQQHIKNILIENLQTTTTLFINSLLNQMNWAFSEFIGMVQEIHNISSRPERVFIESRQLKSCATFFDLAISLLRVIEMIITVAPVIFNNPSQQTSSENLLARLCQLLCQILNRISSQTSCFQHVVSLNIPDLDTVDHFPILVAVVGVLLALLHQDIQLHNSQKLNNSVPLITKTLLSEPSFQISSLYFLFGENQTTATAVTTTAASKVKNKQLFSLENYKNDVNIQEIKSTRQLIAYLDVKRKLLPDNRIINDDDDTCTICYAYPIAATFKPCNHQSCCVCIHRHLLNNRECFFCKTLILQVYNIDGTIIHDFNSSQIPNSSSNL